MLYVDIVDVVNEADGTVSATMVCDGTAVRCEGMMFMEHLDTEQAVMVFEEWLEFARLGEAGYTIL